MRIALVGLDLNDGGGRAGGEWVRRTLMWTSKEEADLSEDRDFADADGQLGWFLGDVYNGKGDILFAELYGVG